MPINPQNVLMQLSPLRPLDWGGGGGAGSGLERQRLRLMRDEFEERKRMNRQNLELSRLEEAGRNARQALVGEQARAEAERKAQADMLAKRQEASVKFAEANAAGNFEGASAMIPYMTSLGMGVELEGEEGGLPRYRVVQDAAFDQAQQQLQQVATAEQAPPGEETAVQSLSRLDAMGYPEDDRGTLDERGLSSEDAGRLLAGGYTPEEAQARGAPVEPDFTGGVPSNVIDNQAMQQATLARLNPMLAGSIGAMPEPFRENAESVARGVRGMGLPATAAIDLYQKALSGPLDLKKAQIDAEAQQGRFEQTQQVAKSNESQDRWQTGYKTMGDQYNQMFGLAKLPEYERQTEEAIRVLTDDKPENDEQVLAFISRRKGERGATTEGDVARVTGRSVQDFLTLAKGWFDRRIAGQGLPLNERNALIGVLKSFQESDTETYKTAHESMRKFYDSPSVDPETARGLRDYANAFIPERIRGKGDGKTAKADATTGASPIPETSRIAREHNNPGNLKFADQAGATKGEAAGDGGHWAKFGTYEEGLAALKAQIEKDAGRGQTVEQFITKYAPPGSNDTAQYIEQAVKALGVQAKDLLSSVDIDKVLAFVAKKESGTEVKPAGKTDKNARVQELLKKGGYGAQPQR